MFDSVQLLFQVVILCITQSSTHNWSPLWRMLTENDSKIPKTAYVSCFDCPCTMCWPRTIYNRMACTVGIRQPCCIHKVALKSRFQTSDGVNQGAAWSNAATQLRHPPDCFCLREEQGLPPQLTANHQCPCDQISLTRPCTANHRYSLSVCFAVQLVCS